MAIFLDRIGASQAKKVGTLVALNNGISVLNNNKLFVC